MKLVVGGAWVVCHKSRVKLPVATFGCTHWFGILEKDLFILLVPSHWWWWLGEGRNFSMPPTSGVGKGWGNLWEEDLPMGEGIGIVSGVGMGTHGPGAHVKIIILCRRCLATYFHAPWTVSPLPEAA
jgi:hypothetical protein